MSSSLTEVNTMAADVKGIIYGINGPVIYIKGKTAFRMGEMVYVGPTVECIIPPTVML